jgi:hypothetical protein
MPSRAVQDAIGAQAPINSAEVSFEHFTVTLVRNTMDALVSSALSQMKGYADLVSTIEQGLGTFQTQLNPPGGTGILAWIQQNLPDLVFTTDGNNEIVLPSTPPKWSAQSVTALTTLFARVSKAAGATLKLKTATGSNPVDQTLTGVPIDKGQLAQGVDPTSQPNVMQPKNAQTLSQLATAGTATILDAVNAGLNDDAALAYSELNALIKMGLYRVVVTDGHILTKATFNLVTTDQSQQNSSDMSSSSFGASASANVGLKWFSAGLKASYSTFNIKVANASSSASTTITENVMGEVLVNFKGDFFPAATVPAQA